MGIKLKAGSKFYSGMTISNGATLYYLVSSHLPSDYAVYLYDKSGNELVRIPKPNDASDSWGNKIATNDIKIAITDNYSLGALYIYDMDGSNMVKVTSSDASANDKFGTTLKINTTKIIVGTPNAPLGSANYVGAVYVYDLDGTNEVKITPSDGAHGDSFSTQEGLGVSESKIFVGSHGHENQTGALYIYDLDGSNEVKVQPSDSAEGDEFGYIVAVSATKVVSTSYGSGAHGAAYIFGHDGTNEVKVEPSVDSRNNSFGQAAAAINNTHVAISDRAFNGNKGAIYIYNIDGSNEVRIEHPSYFNNHSYLGFNLAMSANKVFSCAPNDDDGGSNTGNVYEYNLDGTGERTLPTPSTFATDSRFGQGLYIYDTNLIPYVAPPSAPSAPTPNKILMYSHDNLYNSAINNIRGGLVMSDFDGSNSITLQTLTPQSSAGGDGKVVSITRSNSEIRIYDQTTGQLEQTFNDATVDSAMAAQINQSAMRIAIGAGKIFINAAEYYPNGLGGIIVVDLLDRNVPTYLITPVVSGTYSRIGTSDYGGLRFIEGRIYAGSAPWDATARGIHGFDVDGSNPTFIPTSNGTHSFVKFGDNWAWSNNDDGVKIVSSTGQVLHSKNLSQDYGTSIETTLSGKLVVVDHTQYNSKVYIYDEGFTNEVVISGDQQANDDLWGDGSVTNRAGVAVFGNDILVSAKNADANGLTNCGAVYRYNDSGVLQDIVYGTVAHQMLGQRIEVAY